MAEHSGDDRDPTGAGGRSGRSGPSRRSGPSGRSRPSRRSGPSGGSGGFGSELLGAAGELLGATAEPLGGGYSGETFLVGLAGEQAVLRLYLRDPDRAVVDQALHRLVRGLIPVPTILEARLAGDLEAPPYLLFERVPGRPLDAVLADPTTPPEVRRRAGAQLGTILATLSGMPFLRPGMFAGPDLELRTLPPGDLEQWIQARREIGHFAAWSGDELRALLAVAVDAQALLDTQDRICLCHADLNPKNVLVDPSGSVTALVDWEYAYAGLAHTDLGNLLRFEADEDFCTGVVEAYRERVPGDRLRADFLAVARAADLYALVELAGRVDPSPITRGADELLRTIARLGSPAGGRTDWGERIASPGR